MHQESWPTELRVSADRRTLTIAFAGGQRDELPAELLRVESPSAEVQGHGADEKRLVSGKRNVGIVAVEPVGNYAVRITFDDLHSTGIYSWTFLREMAARQDVLIAEYVAEIAAKGLSRD